MTVAERIHQQCEEIPIEAANASELWENIFDEIWKSHGERHMVIDAATLVAFTFPDNSGLTALSYFFPMHFRVLTRKEVRAIRSARRMTQDQIDTIQRVCVADPVAGRMLERGEKPRAAAVKEESE
jgi:hypothetical protein